MRSSAVSAVERSRLSNSAAAANAELLDRLNVGPLDPMDLLDLCPVELKDADHLRNRGVGQKTELPPANDGWRAPPSLGQCGTVGPALRC